MKLCFIDVETTGLVAGVHSIIQIGAIICGKEEKILMQPRQGATVDPRALDANGITPATLLTYPPYLESQKAFMQTLDCSVSKYDKKDKMFLLAYNAPFDEGFLRNMIGKYYGSYFWWPSIDVAVLAMEFLKKERAHLENFQLSTVYRTITGKPLVDAHDALADVKATKEIYDIISGGKDA